MNHSNKLLARAIANLLPVGGFVTTPWGRMYRTIYGHSHAIEGPADIPGHDSSYLIFKSALPVLTEAFKQIPDDNPAKALILPEFTNGAIASLLFLNDELSGKDLKVAKAERDTFTAYWWIVMSYCELYAHEVGHPSIMETYRIHLNLHQDFNHWAAQFAHDFFLTGFGHGSNIEDTDFENLNSPKREQFFEDFKVVSKALASETLLSPYARSGYLRIIN